MVHDDLRDVNTKLREQQQEASFPVPRVRLDGDRREDRGEPGKRNPEEHVHRAHAVRTMRVPRKDTLCTAVEGPPNRPGRPEFGERPNELPSYTKIPLSVN